MDYKGSPRSQGATTRPPRGSDLAGLLQEQERRQVVGVPPLPPSGQATIPHTDLVEALPDSPIRVEWDLYRREVGRLLAEGQEGRWLLIKDEEIVGIWDTREEADQVRLQRFLLQPVLLKQILAHEPVLHGGGHGRRWLS